MGREFDSRHLHLWLVVQWQNGRLLTVMSEVRPLPSQQEVICQRINITALNVET